MRSVSEPTSGASLTIDCDNGAAHPAAMTKQIAIGRPRWAFAVAAGFIFAWLWAVGPNFMGPMYNPSPGLPWNLGTPLGIGLIVVGVVAVHRARTRRALLAALLLFSLSGLILVVLGPALVLIGQNLGSLP